MEFPTGSYLFIQELILLVLDVVYFTDVGIVLLDAFVSDARLGPILTLRQVCFILKQETLLAPFARLFPTAVHASMVRFVQDV